MTLQQIRDSFVARQKIECAKRQSQYVELGDTLVAKLISDAEMDIQRRCNIIEDSATIDLVSSIYTYELPTNFGEIKTVVYDSNTPLERVDLIDLQEMSGAEGIPTQYSLLLDGVKPKIQFDQAQDGYIVTVYYTTHLNSAYTSLSGCPKLPPIYQNAIIYYMLGQLFDDVLDKYEIELRSLRESSYTNRRTLKFNINGGII